MKISKKILSIVLVLLLVVGMLPISTLTAFAAVGDTFTVDSIEYKITSESEYTVTVNDGTNVTGSCTIPTSVNYQGMTYYVTEIGQDAFKWNGALTNIIIPDGITRIKSGTFQHCGQLSSVTLPDSLTSIGSYAFDHCSRLTDITIPENVTSIETLAFGDCQKLNSITIPANVTNVGSFAFRRCTSLETVLFIVDDPKTIGNYVFDEISPTITYKYADPSDLRWEGTTLKWDGLGINYVRYEVKINPIDADSGIRPIAKTVYTTDHFYDFSGYISPGTYTVSVTAVLPEILDNSQPSYGSSETVTLEEQRVPPRIEISNIYPVRAGVDSANISFVASMPGTMYYFVTDLIQQNPSIDTSGEGMAIKEGYNLFHPTLNAAIDPTQWQYVYVTFKTADGILSEITRIDVVGTSRTTHRLTVTAGANGSIDPGSRYVEDGGSITFTITPNSGYKLDTLTLDGEDVTSAVVDNQYTLSNVTAIHTITAEWVEDSATHIHDLSYSKYGALQIIQTCTGCSHEATATLRSTAVSGAKIYDGRTDFSPTVEYSAGWIGTQPEPVCFKDDKQVNESIDVGEYIARLTVNDVTAEMVYSVTKRIPTVSVKPTVSQIVVGNVLSSVVLNGGDVKGVGGTSIEGEFDWSEPATVMDTLGNQTVKVTFTPESNNYESVEFDIDVNVVNCDTASGEHDFTEWENNDTEHWLVCAKCEAEKPGSREAHKGGTATCQAKANCSECGEEYGGYGAHNWNVDWTTDSEKHWHKCLNTDCTEIKDDNLHSGGSATCKDLAKCEFCDMAYGELGAHGDTEVKDAKEATCTEEGYTGDTYCKVCGEKTADGTVIDVLGHGETEIKDAKDATCTADGYTGDTYCTVCGEKIANGTKVNALGHGETEVKDEKDATCTTEGYTGDTYCTVCKQKIGNGTAIDALGHDYAEKLTAGADTHYYACSRCDSRKDEAAHSYQWITDKEATTSAPGLKHEECACSAKRNIDTEIPQLPNPDVPVTGDDSQILLWTGLLFISALGIVALVVFSRKRKTY